MGDTCIMAAAEKEQAGVGSAGRSSQIDVAIAEKLGRGPIGEEQGDAFAREPRPRGYRAPEAELDRASTQALEPPLISATARARSS